jgi:protein-L-isoaspartate(D-aspartate) O-methyltransferase
MTTWVEGHSQSDLMRSMRFTAPELSIVRRAYARQMLALAGASGDDRLEDAFATVKREDFLGEPPWLLSQGFGYRELPSDDPVPLYQDVLFALSAKRGVNNGSPSLHARWLHAAGLKPGDRVAQLGAGAGYYSAIMAELVGARGHVQALEIDPSLAAACRSNLSARANASVVTEDAVTALSGAFDCIYVNFAVEKPVKLWTDHLAPDGRLIFPLGVGEPSAGKDNVWHTGRGAAFLVVRRPGGLAVRWLGRALFVCAEGGQSASDDERQSLRVSFEKPGIEFVNSLDWDNAGPPERNWHLGRGWRLSFDAVE